MNQTKVHPVHLSRSGHAPGNSSVGSSLGNTSVESGDVVGIGNDRPFVAVEVRPDPGIVGVDGRGHGGCILETYGIEHVSMQFNRLDWVFHMREFGGA